MVIIYDDTFSIRANEYSIDFMNDPRYNSLVTIIEELSGDALRDQEKRIQAVKVIACHKTIRFRAGDSNEFLSSELNAKLFADLEKMIRQANVIYVSFSGQIPETVLFNERYVAMNKRDFYINLKDFLDTYIVTNQFIPKALKFGRNFSGNELLSIQNNLLYIITQIWHLFYTLHFNAFKIFF